jgi:hypothetical protein
MTGMVVGMLLLVAAFCVLMAVLGRMRRQVGGGLGPTELSDGSITSGPTGYPEEMHGHGKKVSSTDNNAAGY